MIEALLVLFVLCAALWAYDRWLGAGAHSRRDHVDKDDHPF